MVVVMRVVFPFFPAFSHIHLSPAPHLTCSNISLCLTFRVLKDAGKIEQNELDFNFDEEGTVEDDYEDDFWGEKGDPKKFKLFKGFGRVLKVNHCCDLCDVDPFRFCVFTLIMIFGNPNLRFLYICIVMSMDAKYIQK